jgi:DNA polymerase-1
MGRIFERIVVVDFEYETSGGEYGLVPGDLPAPLCMVATTLNGAFEPGHAVRLWRGESGPEPPFDVGPDTLFVAYASWAELMCFVALGWKFPTHVFDAHTAYLATSNKLYPHDPDDKRAPDGKGLVEACRAYGIAGWEGLNKGEMARDIGEGRWQLYGRDEVLRYCAADVAVTAELLRRQVRGAPGLPAVDTELVRFWSNYSGKAVARIQARGMLIDVPLWNLVQENRDAVVGELRREFDPSYLDPDPVFSADGKFSYGRFERCLARRGIQAWPRLDDGRLDVDGDAFRLMEPYAPEIMGIHTLRKSLRAIIGSKLPIGRDGRNRPSLFPFGTRTGRNAHKRTLFNTHAGLRPFLIFPPAKIGVYLDWRTQEIAVAAGLSNDVRLRDAYQSGDFYHRLAFDSSLTVDTDSARWKKANPDVRQRMKSLTLAISYGMGVPSLARGLNQHPLIASEHIERFRRNYSTFWSWREGQVQSAMLSRVTRSVFGWPLHLTSSPNVRALFNFPMQSGGADMMRLAVVALCEADIVPTMPVHDGLLLEVDGASQVERAVEIMRWAGREVCNGLEVGVDGGDPQQWMTNGARFHDKREMAKRLWATMMGTLENVGAVPRRRAS